MTATATRYSFRRYRVKGAIPDPSSPDVAAALREHGFRPLGKAEDEQESCGWITTEHLYDTDFQIEKLKFGRYLRFALRVDRRRVPPKVLRGQVEIELAAWREANDAARVPPAKRREIREQVKDKMTREWPAQSASYEVTWHLRAERLYFHATSAAVNEDFVLLFRKSFGLELERLHPFALAHLYCTDVQSENRLLQTEEDNWGLIEGAH